MRPLDKGRIFSWCARRAHVLAGDFHRNLYFCEIFFFAVPIPAAVYGTVSRIACLPVSVLLHPLIGEIIGI